MGILCCFWSTPGVSALFVCLVGVILSIFKKPKIKLDALTKHLLSTTKDIPEQCKACIQRLLTARITKNEKECAEQMRELIQSRCLLYSSLETNPELLLSMSSNTGDTQTNGALWTRFTVQYNLYAGSIVALGSKEQREKLYQTQSTGDLGCFAFTEAGAGVLSGAAFESTAVYDRETESFVIDCPTISSRKRWISQGQFAEHAVIAANLMIPTSNATSTETSKGELKSLGPHLFFARIQTRDAVTGELTPLPGVTVSSVGLKTALLGLDNAIIEFKQFRIPHDALLSRFSSLSKSGEYTTNFPAGVKRMLDLLITRLLTGRIVLSEYTVSTVIKIFRNNWKYCSERALWKSPKAKSSQMMSELPLIHNAFCNYGRCLGIIQFFMAKTRDEVVHCIKQDSFLPKVIEATCVSKFVGTGFSVDAVSAIRKLMGSQALFEESYLGESSFVCNATCAAEGDNTIMELKIVQDLFRGRTQLLPWALLWRCFQHSVGRRVVLAYFSKIAYAMILREATLKEGQLLKDIAWCRAHMLIMDAWVSGGQPMSWLESYGQILVRFPMPTQC